MKLMKRILAITVIVMLASVGLIYLYKNMYKNNNDNVIIQSNVRTAPGVYLQEAKAFTPTGSSSTPPPVVGY